MIIARQSTARTVMVGPVLDADGVAVTDCVVADFEGSVNGGDPAALNGSATLTHRGVGFYSLALTATDLGTVGSFEVTINDTTNACPMKELTVIEEAVYDALFAASATGALPVSSGGIAAAAFAAGAIDAAAIANGAIDAATFAADVDAEILSYLVDDATRIDGSQLNTLSGHDPGETIMGATDSVTVGTNNDKTGYGLADGAITAAKIATDAIDADALAADAVTEIQNGLATAANLATVAGYLDTEIAAILADTNELQTDWADGGRLDLLLDAIKVITDAIGATAAANLAKSCGNAGIVSFTAQTGTLSTTQATTNLAEATNDHYIGRVIIWITGDLAGQATTITDYVGSGGLLTFDALTEAPSNNDTGIIV